MAEEITLDSVPMKSESTEFESQTQAVGKERDKIRDVLLETDSFDSCGARSGEPTPAKSSETNADIARCDTIPRLTDFKPLSEVGEVLSATVVPTTIDVNMDFDDSDERNNNINRVDNDGKGNIKSHTGDLTPEVEDVLNPKDLEVVEEATRQVHEGFQTDNNGEMKFQIDEVKPIDPISDVEDETTAVSVTLSPEKVPSACLKTTKEQITETGMQPSLEIVDQHNLNLTPTTSNRQAELAESAETLDRCSIDDQVQEIHTTIEAHGVSESESITGIGCCVFLASPNSITNLSQIPTPGIEDHIRPITKSEVEIVMDEPFIKKSDVESSIVNQLGQLQLKAKVEIETPSRTEVHPCLEDYESHFNWTCGEEFTFDEAKTIEGVMYARFTTTCMDAEEADLKYNGIEIISNKATQAYCNMVMNKMEDGKFQISEAMDILNKWKATGGDTLDGHCNDYADGVQYVIRGLHMFYLSKHEDDTEAKDQLKRFTSMLDPFELLSVKAKVGVLAMKHFFGTQRRQKGIQQTQLLEQMISMDESHAWYYELFKVLRICRRDQNFRSEPEEKEKAVILEAAKLAPNHPLINLGLCQCLLEIFKNRNFGNNTWKDKIEMGSVATIKSSQELVDFIKARTENILELYGNSVRANIQIAEFFTVLLPYQFRDNAMAKQCLNRALQVAPNSSRANHRMGIYCLTSESNSAEALKHFERSFENDPRNFPALSDIIQTSLGDPLTNGERVKKLLKEQLDNPNWPESKVANLHFLNGYFLYMKREYSSAIDSWITAYRTQSDSIKSFKSVSYFCGRYRWNRKDISLMGIQTVLKKALEERPEDDKEAIDKMLEIITVVIAEIAEKNAIYDANRRGGTGGSRGRGGTTVRGSHNSVSRPGTGIFSNNTNSRPDTESSTTAYRGVGRGSSRVGSRVAPTGENSRVGSRVVPTGESSRGSSRVVPTVESSRGDAIIREPIAPEDGRRGFAPRGTGHRGKINGKTGPSPVQK